MDRALLRLALLFAVVAVLGRAPEAAAHTPEPYHETIQVGPYAVEVGVSEWPILAERSVDITFTPAGGIADKTATIALDGPAEVEFWRTGALGRHPRDRERWGLDLIALPAAGDWTMTLTIDGPQGTGTGQFGPFRVGPRPGPPPAPMWLIGALPVFFLAWLLGRAWLRIRPGRTADARSWG